MSAMSSAREDVPEHIFRIAGHEALALTHVPFRANAYECVRAVFPPDTAQAILAGPEIIDQLIKGADRNSFGPSFAHPEIKEIRIEGAEEVIVQGKISLGRCRGTARVRGVHLKAIDTQFLNIVRIEFMSADAQRCLIEHGNDPNLDAGLSGLLVSAEPGVIESLRGAARHLSVQIGKVQ